MRVLIAVVSFGLAGCDDGGTMDEPPPEEQPPVKPPPPEARSPGVRSAR